MSDAPVRLLCVTGSMREASCSMAVCRHVAATDDAEVRIADPRLLQLPMYEPYVGVDHFGEAAPRIEELLSLFRWCEVMLWVTPTYHGTVSGAFKNMLDFAEFLCDDPAPYLQGKATGMVAINDSTPFAAMRDCARELRCWVAPTHIEIMESEFEPGPVLTQTKALGRLTRLVGELARFNLVSEGSVS